MRWVHSRESDSTLRYACNSAVLLTRSEASDTFPWTKTRKFSLGFVLELEQENEFSGSE